MSSRGRGGKFSKPKRGGGKSFSRDLQPLNDEGEVINMWSSRGPAKNDDDSSDEDSSEEEDDEDEDSDDSENKDAKKNGSALTREERRAAQKARKDAAKAKKGIPAPGDLPPNSDEEDEEGDGELPANPNHTASARTQAATAPVIPDAAPPSVKGKGKEKETDTSNLSRREREALEAQQKREKYLKLHAEGKTDEAKADLARLRLVRERRDAEAARKKAEAEERAEHEKAKTEQMEREARQRALAAGKAARGGKGGKKK